jgi:hypothetical protein
VATLLTFAGLFIALSADAHEVRPAYLELSETAPNEWAATWKQPVLDGRRLKIDPILPEACTKQDERVSRVGATIVQRWTAQCDLSSGRIQITGLDRTLTDAFVRITRHDGETLSSVLRVGADSLNLEQASGAPTAHYLRIGVEHIIFGYDHLLFVLGLFLLVRPRQLLVTVTAFTLAHSITLALSALAGITLPGPPIEIIIALSIALLGAEAIYRQRGQETISARWPWAIAFGFGLIHGFGFAGALAEIGLPRGAEIMALLLFNIGVELGQIAFIACLAGAAWIVSRVAKPALQPTATVLAYAIGITGAFWSVERIVATFL